MSPVRSKRKTVRKGRATSHHLLQRIQEDSEFSSMIPAGAFVVDVLSYDKTVVEGHYYHPVIFRRDDDVQLNSPYDDTDDIWIGHISDIRVSEDKRTVRVKVRWYWSRNDIKADSIKSFDPSKCAPFERVLSDDYDYVSPYSFQAKLYVHHYDEGHTDPPPIGPTDFFVRRMFFPKRKHFKPAFGEGSCVCREAYNPYPDGFGASSHAGTGGKRHTPSAGVARSHDMRFCPNPECRKWYHASCLSARGHIDSTAPAATRELRLLAADPDNTVCCAPALAYFCNTSCEDMDDLDLSSTVDVDTVLKHFAYPPETLAHLPASLLAIAQCPIVRSAGASGGWAIGNVADVVLARRLVYTALAHRGPPATSAAFAALRRGHRARQAALARGASDPHASPARPAGALLVVSPASPRESGGWDSKGKRRAAASAAASEPPEKRPLDELGVLEALCDDLATFDGVLASVHEPYWERRLGDFERAEQLLTGPPFVCPQCQGAI